ncbi:MAG: peptidogalycan biosysnthesis protein [Solidesulfovibrio sp.]
MSEALSVLFVDSQADIPVALWDACLPPPLEGRFWYAALEQSDLGDQFTFFYALLREGERPVGLAPLFQMDVPIEIVVPGALLPFVNVLGRVFPSLLHQRTVFVGSPCADEGSVGVLPGVDRRAAFLCLQQAIDREARRRRVPMLVWKDFPQPCADDLGWMAARSGLFPMVSFPGTVAVLPGPDKEDFFAAMKGTRRRQLKKKLRISAEKVAVDGAAIQHPEGRVLDEIYGLFWQTYEHATTRFERLGRRFFEQMAALPHAYFLILREAATGDMLAFMLCFDMGGHIINKFIGLDYSRPKDWSLYFRLWEAALDWALTRGASAIQSGQTGYAPKMEMGHALVPLSNYCRHVNPLVQWVYALVARGISWRTLDAALARYAEGENG